jgi:hypothetical protein
MHEHCRQILEYLSPGLLYFFRSLFAKGEVGEGRDVIMSPMNSCERKGVNGNSAKQGRLFYLYMENTYTELRDVTRWRPKRYESGQTKTKRGKREGNVPRRDLKKEGKKKETITAVCLCSKGATVAEATGAAAINFCVFAQLSQAAGRIADSQSQNHREGCGLLHIRVRSIHRNSFTKSGVPKY